MAAWRRMERLRSARRLADYIGIGAGDGGGRTLDATKNAETRTRLSTDPRSPIGQCARAISWCSLILHLLRLLHNSTAGSEVPNVTAVPCIRRFCFYNIFSKKFVNCYKMRYLLLCTNLPQNDINISVS